MVARNIIDKLSEIIDSIINQRRRSDLRVCGDMFVYIYIYIRLKSERERERARAQYMFF